MIYIKESKLSRGVKLLRNEELEKLFKGKEIGRVCQEMKKRNIIIQRYIVNPILFKGKKMDLRYYLLVTHSKGKLEFEIIEGFGRLAQSLYSDTSYKVS